MEIKNGLTIKTDSGEVFLSEEIVRNSLAIGKNITTSEIHNFIQMCYYRKLNPFLKEAHLVKYGDKAQIIVGKDAMIKRLHNNPTCEGYQPGVIVWNKEKGEIIERDGTFYLPEEQLVGAFTEIKRKGWDPFKWTVKISDYYRTYFDKQERKEKPMPQWASMPGIMLVKCCIVAAIRNVYPEDFAGCYTEEELGVDTTNINVLPDNPEPNESELLGDEKNKGKMQQLCIAAQSKKVKFKSEDLLKYVMKKLVEKGFLESESKKDIPMNKFNNVLTAVQDLVKKKEKKAEEEIKKLENKKKEDENLLPPAKYNHAKPIENVEDKKKKTKDETKNEK